MSSMDLIDWMTFGFLDYLKFKPDGELTRINDQNHKRDFCSSTFLC